MMTLEQIDKNNDKHISQKELIDAIQPGGFLDNPQNTTNLANILEEQKNKELIQSLKNTITTHIDQQQDYTTLHPNILQLADMLMPDTAQEKQRPTLSYIRSLTAEKIQELIEQKNSTALKSIQLIAKDILGINTILGRPVMIDGINGYQTKIILAVIKDIVDSDDIYKEHLFKQSPQEIYAMRSEQIQGIETKIKPMIDKETQTKNTYNTILQYEKKYEQQSKNIQTLQTSLQKKREQYNALLARLQQSLQDYNTRSEKGKRIGQKSTQITLLLPTIGLQMLPFTQAIKKPNSTEHTQEQIQLYDQLSNIYDSIIAENNRIQEEIQKQEQIQREVACSQYELIKIHNPGLDSDQALINLISKYGQKAQEKYKQDIQQAANRVNTIQKSILLADIDTLQKITKEKDKQIDIVQQTLANQKILLEEVGEEITQVIDPQDYNKYLTIQEINNARIQGQTTSVRDNTAVSHRQIQTQIVQENGNIIGSYNKNIQIDGKTSTKANQDRILYGMVADKFRYIQVPGMGKILSKIEPDLINKLNKPPKSGEKIVIYPQRNEKLGIFETTTSCIYTSILSKDGSITYTSRSNPPTTETISPNDYQSLLLAKDSILDTAQKQVQQIIKHSQQIQQSAKNLQNIAQLYAAYGGSRETSKHIVQDISKSDIKKQIEGFVSLLDKNNNYIQTIQRLKAQRSGIYDTYEYALMDIENQLLGLDTQKEKLQQLLQYSNRESADSREIKELCIMVGAIAGAVVLSVATGGIAAGAGGIMIMSAAGSLGAMAGQRITQEIFAYTADTQGLINNLHSDIREAGKDKEKRKKILPSLAHEFAVGTATTAMFIGSGRIIGLQLQKFVAANAGSASPDAKFAHRIRKNVSKLNDQEIQLLEKRGFSKFMTAYRKEFVQELGQESSENIAERIYSPLGSVVAIITCIGGKRSYKAGKSEVFMRGYDTESKTTRIAYTGDQKTIQSDIEQNFHEHGYSIDTVTETGDIYYSKTNPKGEKETIIFSPTQESIAMLQLDFHQHSQAYGLTFTQKTEKGHIYSYNQLQSGNNNLQVFLQRNKLIIDGQIDPNGTFTAIAPNGETIVFQRNTVTQENITQDNPIENTAIDKKEIVGNKNSIESKIDNNDFELPLKKGEIEYKKINPDGTIQDLAIGEITIEQAKECFINGLLVSAEIFQDQNRVVLSSGSLFLNVEGYKKLGGDIDIATDVQTFINIAINKTDGTTILEKYVQEGKIQDLKFTTIKGTQLEIGNLTESQIKNYIEKGDIRVEFNIKSKDGLLINTEFFPEPPGYGLIQLGTSRTEGKIKEYSIDGKSITTVNEELAAKSYLINLAHEIQNNSIEGMLEGKKIKDAVRINNIFEHLVSLGIKVPQDMIGFIEETIVDYKNQPGFDGNMSKYLEEGLIGLEKTKEIFQEIDNDYKIVKANSTSRGRETTINFNDFVAETYKIKEQLLNVRNKGENIPDNIYDQIHKLQKKVNIHDPKSFAFYYELYIIRSKFIKPLSNKL